MERGPQYDHNAIVEQLCGKDWTVAVVILRKPSLNPKNTLGSSRPQVFRLESRGEVEKFTPQEEEVGGLMGSIWKNMFIAY